MRASSVCLFWGLAKMSVTHPMAQKLCDSETPFDVAVSAICPIVELIHHSPVVLCSRVFRLPGEQKAVLTIPKKNSRKVRRKVGISTTQHGLYFTEKSQRQNQTHRTFSGNILKPGLKMKETSWNSQQTPGKMPILSLIERCKKIGQGIVYVIVLRVYNEEGMY